MSGLPEREAEFARKRAIADEAAEQGLRFCLATYGAKGHQRIMAANAQKLDQRSTTGECFLCVASGKPWAVCYPHVPYDQRGLAGRGFAIGGWGGLDAEHDWPILNSAFRQMIETYQAAHR